MLSTFCVFSLNASRKVCSRLHANMQEFLALTIKRLALAKPDVTVLHPGPMNRGLEISWDVGYCDNAKIRDEVQNGVAVRMALLFLTLTGGKQIENIN